MLLKCFSISKALIAEFVLIFFNGHVNYTFLNHLSNSKREFRHKCHSKYKIIINTEKNTNEWENWQDEEHGSLGLDSRPLFLHFSWLFVLRIEFFVHSKSLVNVFLKVGNRYLVFLWEFCIDSIYWKKTFFKAPDYFQVGHFFVGKATTHNAIVECIDSWLPSFDLQ